MLTKYLGEKFPIAQSQKQGAVFFSTQPTKERDVEVLEQVEGVDFFPTFKPDYRLSMFIAGPPGCGKSTYLARVIAQRHAMFPKRPIYLFTGLSTDDKAFREISVTKVRMEPDDLLSLKLEHLRHGKRGALCIFDDIDGIRPESAKKACLALIIEILMNGRDHTQKGEDLDILITTHEINDQSRTKYFHSNCDFVTFFPFATPQRQLEIALDKIGIGHIVEEIKKQTIDERTCTIHKVYPLYQVSPLLVKLIK